MTRYAPLWQQAGIYPATLDRQLLAMLWPAGGVNGGRVSAVTNTMNVSIAAGACAVALTGSAGVAACRWDAAEVVTLDPAPPSGQSRIDLIVCQVRDNELDGGGDNDFVFETVTGAPAASNPVAPATPANAFALATILVPGGAANLNTATLTTVAIALLPFIGARIIHGPNVIALAASGGRSNVNGMAFSFNRGGFALSGTSGLVVPTTGLYNIRYGVGSSNLASNGTPAGNLLAMLYKPGQGPPFLATQTIGPGGWPAGEAGDILPLSAGDTLQLDVTNYGPAQVFLDPANGRQKGCFISAQLVG